MRGFRIQTQAALLFLLVTLTQAAEPAKPPVPAEKERCSVCGMFVTKYSKWVAAVVLNNGSAAFFDGPKDMFRYYFSPEKYTKGGKQADLKEIYVTEYYTAQLTRAEDLYFVLGSDVLGPMGQELVPVKGRAQADGFFGDHKGRKVLEFEEVTASEIASLK